MPNQTATDPMFRDPTTSLLMAFEVRFDAHGHDTVIDALQVAVPGESRLRCTLCEKTSTIYIYAEKRWTLLDQDLDGPCPQRRKTQ